MLNFNCHITDIIDSQATTRKTSAFITYSTKKQVMEAEFPELVLDGEKWGGFVYGLQDTAR